jgi:hypothetical protein
MRAAFDALVDEFCALTHLQDPEYVRQGGTIELDGVHFSLIHDVRANEELFFLYVDFGAPPAEREATVYYELLKRNFLSFTGKGPAFTISPVTGHVVYVEHFALGRALARDVADAVLRLAEQALDWRQTQFLSGRFALRVARAEPPEQFAAARV